MRLFRHSAIRSFGYSIMLFFLSCTSQHSVIEGTLPDDQYDNETVYWVPFTDASPQTVDSTHIRKNTFRLEVSKYNRNKMGIVRVKPHFRPFLQEILVFTEAGTVQVKLDTFSSASGTPLNGTLQNWKNRKRQFDREVSALRVKQQSAATGDEAMIRAEIEQATDSYYDDVFQMVWNNQNNEIGKFIYMQHKTSFTTKQNSILEELIN